jgi:hypothetical protein
MKILGLLLLIAAGAIIFFIMTRKAKLAANKQKAVPKAPAIPTQKSEPVIEDDKKTPKKDTPKKEKDLVLDFGISSMEDDHAMEQIKNMFQEAVGEDHIVVAEPESSKDSKPKKESDKENKKSDSKKENKKSGKTKRG